MTEKQSQKTEQQINEEGRAILAKLRQVFTQKMTRKKTNDKLSDFTPTTPINNADTSPKPEVNNFTQAAQQVQIGTRDGGQMQQ